MSKNTRIINVIWKRSEQCELITFLGSIYRRYWGYKIGSFVQKLSSQLKKYIQLPILIFSSLRTFPFKRLYKLIRSLCAFSTDSPKFPNSL
jgi:hypothetical protein